MTASDESVGRANARTSSTKKVGFSKAAKWPPLGASVQWTIFE